jgi:hypothetical protein
VVGLCAAPGGSGGAAVAGSSGRASNATTGDLLRGMGGRLILLDKPHARGAVPDVIAVVTVVAVACGSQPALSLPTALSLVSPPPSAYACAVDDGPPLLRDGGRDGRTSLDVLTPELCWNTDVDEPTDAAEAEAPPADCVSAPVLLHGRLLPRPRVQSSVDTATNVLVVPVMVSGKRKATTFVGSSLASVKSRMC